jgi:hypothetical protein
LVNVRFPMRSPAAAIAVLGATLAVAGCGSGSANDGSTRTAALPAPIRRAQHVSTADFPAVQGRTLQAIANTVKAGPKIGLASSVLVPGTQRVAFGVLDADNRFLYGKSAVYVADSPGAKAHGPYLAPADSIVPAPPFLSRTAAADTADIKAVYAAQVPFPAAGRYAVLAVTEVNGELMGAPTQITVRRSSPIPTIGQAPPRISTPTVASVGGDIKKIDTRVPPDDMHKVDFKAVLGKRPVALLFSTPQLCQSRVCGPVTDIALQMEHEFGTGWCSSTTRSTWTTTRTRACGSRCSSSTSARSRGSSWSAPTAG